MKYFLLVLAFWVTACAAPASVTTPTPAPTSTPVHTPTPEPIVFSEPDFIFKGEDPSQPIVTRKPSPKIQNFYINPGGVVFHEGQFHMFFNSFTAWPGVIQVGYMTSEDGYHWQMEQEEPVFTSDEVPFGSGHADVSSALVQDDGTWVLYFHTISAGQIGRATAASPLGPWTVDPEPVLNPGPAGAWDEQGVFWPCVLLDEDGYRLYYGGQNPEETAIGYATSPDGINWTKYDDPQTTGELNVESDPVLMAEVEWERTNVDRPNVDRPRVTHSPDGWVMVYQGGRVETRGLALSRDGVHWETYPSNPIFTTESFPVRRGRTWDTKLLYQDGVYYYFMEVGTSNGTDLYLTTHEGALRK